MTYKSLENDNDIPVNNGNSHPADEHGILSVDSNDKIEVFTAINQSCSYINSIDNSIQREYEMIQECKRLDIPLESYRRLLEEYLRVDEDAELNNKVLKPVKFIDQRLGDFVAWCEQISLYKLSVVVGQATLLLAMGSYVTDAPQRQQQELNDAKKMILDHANLRYNESRIEAFEFLNQNCESMVGIQSPNANMPNIALNKCYEFRIDLENFLKKPILFHYKGVNLGHANLLGANLAGANLAGANLAGANLEGANLAGANLEGANLAGANLKYTNFRRANLKGANLKGASIQYSSLGRANLKNADLSEANLKGSGLLWVDLSHAKLDYTNLSHARLSRANLQGADLYRTNLENSLLPYVDLRKEANLRQAKLANANLKNAYFSSISQLERANDWQTALIDFNWQEKIVKPRKLPKIGVVIPSLETIFEYYLEGLWSVPGVEVITMYSDDTVEGEAKTIQNLVKEGVDAIVVRPQDPQESVLAIKVAFRQGIIPITIGDCIDKNSSRRYVFGCYESDSFKMGYDSTQALLGYMKRKYPEQMINVGLVDGTKSGRVYPYFQGFKQAMEKSGVQWQEVASTDAMDREDIGKIKQMLQSYPQINVIWSGSDMTTDIAIQAIQELGLGNKIKVFGMMDLTPEKAKMLADPTNPLQSIIDQSPTEAGKKATERILQVINRENLEYQYQLIPHRLMSNSN
jgi:uncharacterized protein YjbI with pentapeptide repeats/ABC-type sugar transport system substrate-binding protein